MPTAGRPTHRGRVRYGSPSGGHGEPCALEVTSEQPHREGTAPVVVSNAGRAFSREGSAQLRTAEGNFSDTTPSARITPSWR